jgi:hypothetical protein
MGVYRGVNRIEKKHRVAVLRAADNVAKRLGHWEKWQCKRFGRRTLSGVGAVFVNVIDLHSYAIGRLRADSCHAHETITEPEARLEPDGKDFKFIERGGAWWIHVERTRAKRGISVDDETRAMIAADEAEFQQYTEATKKILGGSQGGPEEVERRKRRDEANKHGRICGKCGTAIGLKDTVMRVPVADSNFLRRGMHSTVEIQCVACGVNRHRYLEETKCDTCGRKVFERFRRDRRRTFCCEDCRRRPASVRALSMCDSLHVGPSLPLHDRA